MADKDRILFVDDEQSVLDGFRRRYRKEYHVQTATSGSEALQRLSEEKPFSVVVADMRMPEMDGVEFLSKAREKQPDAVRLMLTGYGDLDTAISAVNEGNIFRFLTKPCPDEQLSQALADAVEQYHLVIAERELLQQTLQGSIKVLTDILSMSNPAAFSRGMRIKRYVSGIVHTLQLQKPWQYEVAAMLSQIGWVTLPEATSDKVYSGKELDAAEQEMFNTHPEIARSLIAHIPRLEKVADMVKNQHLTMDRVGQSKEAAMADPGLFGGHILRIANDFDTLRSYGYTCGHAVEELRKKEKKYSAAVLDALGSLPLEEKRKVITIPVRELSEGTLLAEDLYDRNGVLLLARGQEVTAALRQRIKNLYRKKSLDEYVKVETRT